MTLKRLTLLGMLVASVGAATVAEAAPPATQPKWFHFGGALESNIAVSAGSSVSRLWMTKKMLVIVCAKDADTGTLEPNGRGKFEFKYKECKPFKPEENAATVKQFEEGSEYAGCIVKTTGAANGEVVSKSLKTRLVWVNRTESGVLNNYEPEAQPFVEIKIENSGAEVCAVSGTYKVEGSVLSLLRAYSTATENKEGIAGVQLFDVKNEEVGGKAKMVQGFISWIVEGGGAGKEGRSELKLLEGTESTPLVLESIEQLELNRVSGKRGLFAGHE